jgi:hypothetical protein
MGEGTDSSLSKFCSLAKQQYRLQPLLPGHLRVMRLMVLAFGGNRSPFVEGDGRQNQLRRRPAVGVTSVTDRPRRVLPLWILRGRHRPGARRGGLCLNLLTCSPSERRPVAGCGARSYGRDAQDASLAPFPGEPPRAAYIFLFLLTWITCSYAGMAAINRSRGRRV